MPPLLPFYGLRCAVTNPLHPGDVVELGPGESTDPFEPIDGYHGRVGHLRADFERSFLSPGRFRVLVSYNHSNAKPTRVAACAWRSRTARLRALHVPIPERPPLEVEGLRSNWVDFAVVDEPAVAGFRLVEAPHEAPFPTSRVLVRLLDEVGRDIPGARVAGLGPLVRSADGSLSRQLPPGGYAVSASTPAGASLGNQELELSAGSTRTLSFRKPGFGSLRLVVNNQLEGARVEFRLYRNRLPAPSSLRNLDVAGPYLAPNPGEEPFFPRVPVGTWTLVILPQGQLRREFVEVRVNEERRMHVVVPAEASTLE